MKPISKIIEAVSNRTNVEPLAFYRPRRSTDAIADARALASVIAVNHCGYSAAHAGREMKMHHTSVLSGLSRIQQKLPEREYLRDALSLALLDLDLAEEEPFVRRVVPDDLLIQLQAIAA
jgi:chromosomal replication initiation ATPase DnaA